MMTMLDGNAAAGVLADVFGRDLTGAEARCAGCGATGPLAAALTLVGDQGVVVRCRDCDEVLLTVVRAEASCWVSMRGLAAIRITNA